MTTCQACDTPATRGWQRHATRTEVERLAADPACPSVQLGETSARIQVLACDEHAIPDDLAVATHDADCPAPRTPCGCSVSA